MLGVAAGALAVAGLVRHPAALAGVAVFYGLYRLVLVVVEARLQERIRGSARATVTSVASFGTEIAGLAMFGMWALGESVLVTGLLLVLAVVLVPRCGSGSEREPIMTSPRDERADHQQDQRCQRVPGHHEQVGESWESASGRRYAAVRSRGRQVEERAPLFRALGSYLSTPERVMVALSALLMISRSPATMSPTVGPIRHHRASPTVQVERPDQRGWSASLRSGCGSWVYRSSRPQARAASARCRRSARGLREPRSIGRRRSRKADPDHGAHYRQRHDAHVAEIVYGRLDAQLPMPRAHLTGTVQAAVSAIADAIEQTNATAVDVQVFADVLRDAVREGVSALWPRRESSSNRRCSGQSAAGCRPIRASSHCSRS